MPAENIRRRQTGCRLMRHSNRSPVPAVITIGATPVTALWVPCTTVIVSLPAPEDIYLTRHQSATQPVHYELVSVPDPVVILTSSVVAPFEPPLETTVILSVARPIATVTVFVVAVTPSVIVTALSTAELKAAPPVTETDPYLR